MTVKLCTIKSTPDIDPMLRDVDGELHPTFWLSLDRETAGVSMDSYAPGTGTPEDEWNGRTITYDLNTEDGIPDEDSLIAYLHSPESAILLQRIYAGGSVDWDGNNNVGCLDDDSITALEELIADISRLPRSNWTMWGVDNYLQYMDIPEGCNLDELVAEIEATAECDHVIINGDIMDYFKSRLANE